MASYTEALAEGVRKNIYNQDVSAKELESYEIYYEKAVNDFYMINRDSPGEISYNDLFLQYDGRGLSGGPLEMGWVVSQFHYYLMTEKANLSAIYVGENPYADKREEDNHEALNSIKQYGFDFDTWFGNADCDGVIKLNEADYEHEDVFSMMEQAPLEVGTSQPFVLFAHLHFEGVFARWPYGSEFLYIYSLTKQAHKEKISN